MEKSSGITIAVESHSDELIDELKPLIKRHYDEIALNKEDVPLDPDWDQYKALGDAGRMLVVCVRNENSELIGYSVFFLAHHIHYKQTLVANNDVLYLAPEHRNSKVGLRLIKDSETACRARGVNKIIWHVKFAHDFRDILYRLGYADEDAIVGKILRT